MLLLVLNVSLVLACGKEGEIGAGGTEGEGEKTRGEGNLLAAYPV
jgi:hypothetical protein